ncbi:MAG: co-chaperone GroES [Deltaproteobacteria bacterium]|nr:co-chaperone GroES [Deltaproteobacteria bacterium]
MKVKPLQDRVLLKRLEVEEKTAGGIIIPDTAKEKPQECEVIAVGAGKTLESGEVRKPSVSNGDKVLIGKYSGSEIKIDGEEHIIVREDEILAVIS